MFTLTFREDTPIEYLIKQLARHLCLFAYVRSVWPLGSFSLFFTYPYVAGVSQAKQYNCMCSKILHGYPVAKAIRHFPHGIKIFPCFRP